MGLMGAMFKTYSAKNKSRSKIAKLQNKRLKKLVKYARNNSSYFEELYKKGKVKMKNKKFNFPKQKIFD